MAIAPCKAKVPAPFAKCFWSARKGRVADPVATPTGELSDYLCGRNLDNSMVNQKRKVHLIALVLDLEIHIEGLRNLFCRSSSALS